MFLTMANGEALNFRVKAYATEEELLADAPTYNTIGVEVGSFTNYVISATEPKDPTAGLLWIQIGNDSSVDFLATRSPAIYLHPIKAHIYNTPKDEKDTGWETLVSYLYANSKWNLFGRLYFVRNVKYNETVCTGCTGGTCGYSGEETTGGFFSKSTELGFEFDVTKTFYGGKAANGILLMLVDANAEYPLTWLEVDLTHYKKLVFTGMFEKENDNSSAIYGCYKDINPELGYRNAFAASVTVTEDNTDDVVVDVSGLEGKYYICCGIRSCRMRIDKWYLEM